MNIKKYVIGAGLSALLISGATSLVLAENDMKIQNNLGVERTSEGVMMHAQSGMKMVLEVGPAGRVLMRGTVKTVGTNSLTVTSWGGDWMVNISSTTNILPTSTMSQFVTGDFVGVQGSVVQGVPWTIDATLVRDWTAKKAEQTNKQEIKNLMQSATPRNWQGIATSVNTSTNSLTLTIDGTAYTVNLAANARVVNFQYINMNLADIKSGDTVRIWATVSGTTATAYVVRDTSVGVPAIR